MPARMTLRERATTALEGRMPDQIPFTCYSNMLPDGAEAREAWPDKALSINFPSSVHLTGQRKIEGMTLELLRQAAPLAGGAGFVVGITGGCAC